MEQDDEFAFEWYLKAAEQQDVVAQRRVGMYIIHTYIYGICFEEGKGCPRHAQVKH